MSSEVVVVGGGVIGLTIALECRRRDLSVTLLDRGAVGRGATWAAGGVLSPTDEHEWTGELGAFNARALARWPGWAERLQDETGRPAGYARRGELRFTGLEVARAGCARLGLACEELDPGAVSALEPELVGELRGLHLPGTGALEGDVLIAALVDGCERAGVVLRPGTAVHGLERAGERVVGVRVDAGVLAAEQVVLAAGAWSAELFDLPVRPVLGEGLVVTSPGRPLCSHLVRTSGGAILPRADGSFWLGTTVADRGYQDRPSLGGVHAIIDNFLGYLPAVAGALLVEARSGLRPTAADGVPVVGAAGPDGLVLATGHGREGLIHAPLCAEGVAQGLADGDWSGVPASFDPDRFGAAA